MTEATSTQTATKSDLVATIGRLYAAFGSGDIPAILAMVSEDIQWEQWGDSFAQRADVPWMRARSGRAGVGEFFGVAGTLEIVEFEVLDLLASERQVCAEVVIEAKLPDGGRYRDEELHLWTFDDAGKICRLRHYTDTAKHIAAMQGEDTTRR